MRLADRNLRRRFDAKYIPEPNSGCWLWTDCVDKHGYGRLQYGPDITLKAHRVSYELYNGPIPDGAMVLHRCDVRCCVNPTHLYAGTALENVHDALRRGRYRPGGKPHPGERNGRAVLTESQVRQIRTLKGSASAKTIGAGYGVCATAIPRVWNGQSWAHVQ